MLVQLKLLLRGIESAPLTIDYGIDLVAYSPRRKDVVTIQVKANRSPKPGGGKGKPALDWWVSEDSPAQLVALVDLSSLQIWLFTMKELARLAQQRSSGRLHLYMYVDPAAVSRKKGRVRMEEFEDYLFERRVQELL